MSSISSLFNLSMLDLLEINHMTEDNSSNLKLRREIIIPVKCSCVRTFSHSIFMYHFSSTDSFASVACGIFEGLLKAQGLKQENPDFERNIPGDFMIKVPIRCACPNSSQRRNGVKYLVTYPVIENDHSDLIARKFGVPKEIIWDAKSCKLFQPFFLKQHYLFPQRTFPNGSLRDCFSNATVARQLIWAKRIQIAFDLAVGFNYIHYCTKPSFIHHNIHSRNVLITTYWRAKITGFRLAKPVICSEEIGEISWNEPIIVSRKGYLAPEYLTDGLAALKVDVFAFGVVLLELLSAKEAATDGKVLKDFVNIFGDVVLECSSGYLEKLKEFMDPNLEGDLSNG
ncbi:hypothetical protein CRYUN_Cryun19dG0021800 [Craigia yunnanensis]